MKLFLGHTRSRKILKLHARFTYANGKWWVANRWILASGGQMVFLSYLLVDYGMFITCRLLVQFTARLIQTHNFYISRRESFGPRPTPVSGRGLENYSVPCHNSRRCTGRKCIAGMGCKQGNFRPVRKLRLFGQSCFIVDRAVVAGAVLQTSSSFIDSLTQ